MCGGVGASEDTAMPCCGGVGLRGVDCTLQRGSQARQGWGRRVAAAQPQRAQAEPRVQARRSLSHPEGPIGAGKGFVC